MSIYKAGDEVEAVAADIDMTIGNIYTVNEVCEDGDIGFIDDAGDQRYKEASYFKEVVRPHWVIVGAHYRVDSHADAVAQATRMAEENPDTTYTIAPAHLCESYKLVTSVQRVS